MVFTMPCSRRPDLRRLLLGVWLVLFCTLARADNIFVQSVEFASKNDEYQLSATFDIGLTPPVENALNKGVPLYFVVEFELIYPRWYTLFFLNKRIAGFEQIYRLSYNALTRQYLLSYGVLQQSFDTLADALAVLGGIKDQRVLTDSRLDEDRLYEAQVRMRLDSSRLPKPFQVYAFGSIAWDVSSSWFRWTVRP
jgi:hypothetical protein